MNLKTTEIFQSIFYPNSIAVIGASNDLRKPGGMYVCNLVSSGFRGKFYPVSPRSKESFGLKVYPHLRAIPEPIDYAIVCVERRYIPRVTGGGRVAALCCC